MPPMPAAPINPIGPALSGSAVPVPGVVPPPPYSGLFYPPVVPPVVAPVVPVVPPVFPAAAVAAPPAPFMVAPTMMGGYGMMPAGGMDYGEPSAKKMKVEASKLCVVALHG